MIDSASDETMSLKIFLTETTSSLVVLKESINNLLISCNTTLEKFPSISATVDKLKSTEISVSRDPSLTKNFCESELRFLVNQGPYQPVLSRYPVNETFKKK
jgi:hypothetical protein